MISYLILPSVDEAVCIIYMIYHLGPTPFSVNKTCIFLNPEIPGIKSRDWSSLIPGFRDRKIGPPGCLDLGIPGIKTLVAPSEVFSKPITTTVRLTLQLR